MVLKRWQKALPVCVSKAKKSKRKNKKSRKKSSKAKDWKHHKCVDKSYHVKKDEPKKQSELAVERCRYPCRRYEEFHDHFLTYDQILNFLAKMEKNHPGTVQLFNIGQSGQGKPIYMVFITTDTSQTSDTKFAAFIEAGLKGDDTFAVSNALFVIDYLCKNVGSIKIMDYFIVPCGNPDAYDKFVKSKNNDENITGTKRTSSKEGNDLSAKKPRLQTTKSKNPGSTQDTDATSAKSNNDSLGKKGLERKPTCKNLKNSQQFDGTKSDENSTDNRQQSALHMDLSMNFPVYLGANDMRNIPTSNFLDKIGIWKENYVSSCPETMALVRAIHSCQFAIKLLISLQEGGETICYPFGFCKGSTEESKDLKEVAKKGKSGIVGRPFQYGSIYEMRGLTYGSLVDFLKMTRSSIKYMYAMQVHKKTCRYDEKRELRELVTYGCQIMESIKRMSTAVFKTYTNMTGNRKVETECVKRHLKKKSCS